MTSFFRGHMNFAYISPAVRFEKTKNQELTVGDVEVEGGKEASSLSSLFRFARIRLRSFTFNELKSFQEKGHL